MQATPPDQLAICDLCQKRIADRCHVRLRMTICPRCAVFIEAATGEKLTWQGEELAAA